MAKYKIGITEAGDAGLDLSWEPYVDNLDGVVLVTKNITPSFHDAALRNREKAILHATITGYGNTKLEPQVPGSQQGDGSSGEAGRGWIPQGASGRAHRPDYPH